MLALRIYVVVETGLATGFRTVGSDKCSTGSQEKAPLATPFSSTDSPGKINKSSPASTLDSTAAPLISIENPHSEAVRPLDSAPSTCM